ncbi:MAG: sensor histidine kinase [Deltaproteobacteria bacterium]|nr:sensor histidine kinase [Deltaproteobacteria bacterium]
MTRSRSSTRWSIRAKGIALVAGYALVLVAVYGTFTYWLLRRENHQAHERLRQTVDMVAAELDSYIDNGRQRLALVSQLPGLTYGLRRMQESAEEGRIPPWTSLHYLFFKSPVFTGGVFLVDRNFKVLWTEPPGRPWTGERLGNHPALKNLPQLQESIVTPGLGADILLDRPHVVVAFPVRNPDGEVDGALGGIIDLQSPELTKILGAVATTDGRFIEVVDQDGHVIGGNKHPQILQPARTENDKSQDGDPWVTTEVSLAQVPWRVVAGQPRSLALQQVTQVQNELLVFGIGLLLVTLAVGAPAVNRFVTDVRSLTDAAETMAGGDLSHPVPIPSQRDEISTLAQTFEQMRVELGRSRAALEHRLEEREELIRLQEEFLAGISHEMRTPLHAIIGYSDMLADEVQLGSEASQFLSAVRRQSQHLYQMLSDLLTLSGLKRGTLPIDVSPVHVPALLNHLEPLGRRLCEGKGVTVEWDCPTVLPTMETDPLRLEEILTNLLTNAVKFTNSGTVRVGIAHCESPAQMVFTVTDTGIGIPAEALPHIFDDFRRVDGSMTRVHDGVGLGLTLVKRMTNLLHGEIEVASQVGVGSIFTLRLPTRISANKTAARSAA